MLNKSVIIILIKKIVMNLKERGLTVGDLMIILLLVLSTLFIVNKVKERNNQTNFQVTPNEILTAEKS